MEILIMVLISVVMLISTWIIFVKSGESGWKSLIPIYNNIVLLKIVELPFWYIFLYLVPLVNIYVVFKTFIRLAHKFGRTTAFGVGLTLLSPIMWPVLAMSDKDDVADKKSHKINTKDLIVAILIIVGIAIVLSWIFPITYYGYSYTEDAVSPVGLFELFSSWPTLFNFFGTTVFYILTVGGFYGILHQTDGYRNLLDKIVSKFKGMENLFLCSMMLIFTIVTSMAGITTGLLFLFPFVISIIILMGYNKQTAALATIGSVAVGLIGTTVSAVNTTTIVSILQIKFSAEWVTKLIILIIGFVLLTVNVVSYAKKHKNSTETKDEEQFELPVSKNEKKRAWPIIVIIDLILLIMVIGSISWEPVLGKTWFKDLHQNIMTYTIGDYAIFANLFGSVNALGSWTLIEFILVLVLGAGLIGWVYQIKFNTFIKAYFDGMKKALKPATLVAFAYLVLVITAMHPVFLGIFKPMLTATNGFNPFTMSIVAFINSVFCMEPYYIATATGTLQYAASIISDTTVYPTIAIVWQAMQGLAVLIAPTSVVLAATLSYLDVSFWQWIKASWKLILEVLVALLIIFTILILI